VKTPDFDIDAARAVLRQRGMGEREISGFLARSLLTATEAATALGVRDSRAARDALRRWNVKPIGRAAGRAGENRYPADLVWDRLLNRPGRGWRKHRTAPNPATQKKEHIMQSVAELDQHAAHLPWYADHGEVVSLASILVGLDRLSTPHDVIYFFEKPWKWDREFRIWDEAGRPLPPSSDDLAEARMLRTAPQASELKRKYDDDTTRWDALIEAFDDDTDGDDEDR